MKTPKPPFIKLTNKEIIKELENLNRYYMSIESDGQGSDDCWVESNEHKSGDWVAWDDVLELINILKESRK